MGDTFLGHDCDNIDFFQLPPDALGRFAGHTFDGLTLARCLPLSTYFSRHGAQGADSPRHMAPTSFISPLAARNASVTSR